MAEFNLDVSSMSGGYEILPKEEFKDKVSEYIYYAVNQNLPLSLLIADINYLKAINDTFGHQTGDLVIDSVKQMVNNASTLVRSNSRVIDNKSIKPDIVGSFSGHIGGDEFAICAMTNEKGALSIKKRLIKSFTKYIQNEDNQKISDIGVGLAIGAVSLLPGENFDSFWHRADQEMYLDKEQQKPLSQKQLELLFKCKRLLEDEGMHLRDLIRFEVKLIKASNYSDLDN